VPERHYSRSHGPRDRILGAARVLGVDAGDYAHLADMSLEELQERLAARAARRRALARKALDVLRAHGHELIG
jgi:hypothetical protein